MIWKNDWSDLKKKKSNYWCLDSNADWQSNGSSRFECFVFVFASEFWGISVHRPHLMGVWVMGIVYYIRTMASYYLITRISPTQKKEAWKLPKFEWLITAGTSLKSCAAIGKKAYDSITSHKKEKNYDDVIQWKHFPRYWQFCGEFTGPRWIPRTKASDAERWCFLWSAPWINDWANNRESGDLRRHRANYDVIVM